MSSLPLTKADEHKVFFIEWTVSRLLKLMSGGLFLKMSSFRLNFAGERKVFFLTMNSPLLTLANERCAYFLGMSSITLTICDDQKELFCRRLISEDNPNVLQTAIDVRYLFNSISEDWFMINVCPSPPPLTRRICDL